MSDYTFIGFSTAGSGNKRSWVVYDIDLIKADLNNHFNTRIGERLMRPEYGSRLWEYVMEPNVDSLRGLIKAEVERIVRLDTRLEVKNIVTIDTGDSITIQMDLLYRPFQKVEVFSLSFDKRQEVN